MKSKVAFEWTPMADALLGTDTDCRVASRLGLNGDDVFKRRRALGIAGYGRIKQADGGFGWKSTREEFSWTDEADALLPHSSINALANRLDTNAQNIRERMVALGIPVPLSATAKKVVWTPEMDALLEGGRDSELLLAGVSRSAIERRKAERKYALSQGKQARLAAMSELRKTFECFERYVTTKSSISEVATASKVTVNQARGTIQKWTRRLLYFQIEKLSVLPGIVTEDLSIWSMRRNHVEWMKAAHLYLSVFELGQVIKIDSRLRDALNILASFSDEQTAAYVEENP